MHRNRIDNRHQYWGYSWIFHICDTSLYIYQYPQHFLVSLLLQKLSNVIIILRHSPMLLASLFVTCFTCGGGGFSLELLVLTVSKISFLYSFWFSDISSGIELMSRWKKSRTRYSGVSGKPTTDTTTSGSLTYSHRKNGEEDKTSTCKTQNFERVFWALPFICTL